MTHNLLHRLPRAVPFRTVPAIAARVPFTSSQRLATTDTSNRKGAEPRPRINTNSEPGGSDDAEVQKHNEDVEARKGNASTNSNGARPRINKDGGTPGGQDSEEVRKHNEEMKQRNAKTHDEKVTSEDEAVEKNYWIEAGGRNKKG